MWINFDQLLDLPNVTVVNYQKIAQTIFLKLALLNETIECPNCHETLDRINQTEYNLVRDLSILGNPSIFRSTTPPVSLSKVPKVYQRKTEFYEIKTASHNSL
jgi:hypothetical protein